MKKSVFFLLILLLCVFVSAETQPVGGVSYWNFSGLTDLWDGNDATNPNVATSVTDFPVFNISGNSSPNSFDLDDLDDYISVADADNLSFTDGSDNDLPFSINAWIKMDSANLFFIADKGNGDNIENEYHFGTQGTGILQLLLFDSDQTSETDNRIGVVSDSAITSYENQWVMVTATYDGSESNTGMKIFINGSEIATSSNDLGSYNGMDNGAGVFNIGRRTAFAISYADGSIDEYKVFNKELNQTEILNLFNYGTILGLPVSLTSVNESVESTAIVKQTGTINLNSPTFTTVFSSDFNITVNNTDLYGAYSFNVESANSNVLFCELLIDGLVVGNVTRTQTPNVLGSVYLQSELFTLENGTHNQELRCQRSSGGGVITISNAVGIGHILIDENLEVIPHNETIITTTVNTGSTYTLLDEINFTMSNRSIGGDENVSMHLVMEWMSTYSNDGGSSEVLNTYISWNGTNCSFYPRTVSAGGVGSVSGDCLINNATQNATYNIKIYGNGTNSNYYFNLKLKEFLLSPGEIEGGTGFPVPTTFSGDQDVLLFNFTGGNNNHGLTNVFQKNAFSIRSNESTTATFYVQLVNGTNFTTINFTRGVNPSEIGVLIGHDVLQNVPQDNYISKLWANCGSSSAQCTILGGDGIGYITDVTTTIVNSFKIKAFDNFDNNSILNFSVVDGATYITNNGEIDFVYGNETFVNFTVTSSYNGGYFNATFINYNTSNNLNVSLNQTLIKWDCKEKVSGNDLSCSDPTETDVFNYNVVGNPHNQTISVAGYFNNTEFFNVTALQNNTLISTFGSSNITLTVSSGAGTPSGCSYNVTSFDTPSFYEVVTGSSSSSITLINGSYNVVVDCLGFALTNTNFTVENVTQTINTVIYASNSIELSFYNILTNDLINDTNITVQFIGLSAQTVITSNGSVFVDLLSPDEYTIIFDADGYRQGSYIFTLNDRSYNPFDLYMQPENNTELLLMTVKDTYGNYISNSEITIQRYINNSWITEQIRKTDFQGRTEAYFVLSTEFYNFLVSVDDYTYFGVINSNANKKQIYAEDVSNGIEIVINRVNDTVIRTYQSLYGITASLTFVNTSNVSGYFRFSWDDSSNELHSGVLKVYRDGVLNCTSSASSEAGVVYCYVSENETSFYTAVAYLDDEEIKTYTKRYVFNNDFFIDWGSFGFGFLFIVLVLVFFLYLESPTFSLYIGSGLFSLGIVFGLFFSDVSLTVVSLIMALTSLVAGISSKSGGNG